MIENRNRWIFEALGLSAQEALAFTNRAHSVHSASVDPVRDYLYSLATDPPGALPVCEMCNTVMDHESLCYCEGCRDRYSDDVAAERVEAFEQPEALENAMFEVCRLTHVLAAVTKERDLLRETLTNATAPKTRKPRAKKEKTDG